MRCGGGSSLAGLLLGVAVVLEGSGGAPARSAPTTALVDRARAAVAELEYRATRTDRGLQAPNRAHDLRAWFEPDGVRIHDRTAQGDSHLVDLTLLGVGRGAELAPVSPGEVANLGSRVEIRRPELVEWYENGEAGLEQGFTLATRPAGADELVLELSLAGGTALHDSANSLLIRTEGGRTLGYGGLRADDSAGKSLPARFELAAADRIRIRVDDAGATYPVVIDPLVVHPVTPDSTITGVTNNTPALGDLNGDGHPDAIFGLPESDQGQVAEGVVAIAYGTANGVPSGNIIVFPWIQSNLTNANFGSSVASGGDVNGDGYEDLLVGAPGASRAYVFLGGPLGVTSTTIASAHATLNVAGSGNLGVSIAFAGDVNGDGYDDIVVGDFNAARAHIYLGSASGITNGAAPATTLTGTPLTFPIGDNVAAAGDVNRDGYDDVLVNGVNRIPNPNTAHVFCFHGSAAGIASGVASVVADGGIVQNVTAFVPSPAIVATSAGDVNRDGYADVLAGTPSSGLAVVYLGSPSGNINVDTATIFGSVVLFGGSVAGLGDVNGDGYADVAVASPFFNSTDVFLGTASGVSTTGPITPAGLRVTRGADVNSDGYDDLFAAASLAVGGSGVVYHGGSKGIQSATSGAAQIRFESNQASTALGVSVDSAGDVNGDGYGDLIIGASSFDGGEANEGAAFVVHGGPAVPALPILASAASTIQSNRANAFLGIVVSGAGDVNGDGFGDVIIAASNYDDGRGLALIYHGSPTGIVAAGTPANASGRFEILNPIANAGGSVAGAGDVNADGFDDVIVSAPGYPDLFSGAGAAFVLHGSLAGIGDRLPATANARLLGTQSGGGFGIRVSAAGDVNRDGFGDVMVNASAYSNPELFEGAAFVFHGSANGFGNINDTAANSRIESNQFAAASLNVMGPAGDVNNDGYGDVLFGMPTYASPEVREGGAWLFVGGPTGITGSALADATSGIGGNSADLLFGNSVAPAGDVNGDGFGDWLVGSPGSVTVGNDVRGRALLYLGSASPTFAQTAKTITSEQPYDAFGVRVGFAGDVNGDAMSDVIVGATEFESTLGETTEGLAVVFQGNVGGLPVTPTQHRTNISSPLVAPGNTSALATGFSAQFLAANQEPNGRIAGEFQACPVGTAFGAPGCTTAVTPYQSGPGTAYALLDHQFTGLAPDTRYRWRARALFTDDTGPIPAFPDHGPWRSVQPSLAGYDIRTARDSDADGVFDSIDNCPRIANPGQEDAGGLGSTSSADLIGDACQCGNVFGSGRIDALDVSAFRAALANPSGAPLSAAAQTRCVVLAPGSTCSVAQLTVIRRALNAPALYPITTTPAAQFCAAAVGP